MQILEMKYEAQNNQNGIPTSINNKAPYQQVEAFEDKDPDADAELNVNPLNNHESI